MAGPNVNQTKIKQSKTNKINKTTQK